MTALSSRRRTGAARAAPPVAGPLSLAVLGALAVSLALGGLAALAGAPASMVVEDWSRQPAGQRGVPEGWKTQTWGSPKYDFAIESGGSGPVLRLRSEGDSSNISKEVAVDLTEYPILEWRWKVTRLPAGADLRKKATDDQAAQLYVVFPRFPTAVRSRIIGYVWDTSAPEGLVVPSTKTGTVTYVVVRSGEGDRGRWITERRNVRDDYLQIYGEPPQEPVGGISIGIDSDDVKGRAESYFGPIAFLRSAP